MGAFDDPTSYDVAGTHASQHFATAVLLPFAIGYTIAFMLFGLMVGAAYIYITGPNYSSDSRRTKMLLWWALALATAQIGVQAYTSAHYYIYQLRDANTLLNQTLGDAFGTIFVGILGASVQAFLSFRVSKLFSNRLARAAFLVVIGAGIICGVFGACGYLALSLHLKNTGNDQIGLLDFAVASACWLWGCAISDTVITVGLLVQVRSKMYGFNDRTDSILRKVALLSLETASYTTFFALGGAICSSGIGGSSLYANVSGAFWQPLAPCYALSLVVTLSGRRKIAQGATSVHNTSQIPRSGLPPTPRLVTTLSGRTTPLSRELQGFYHSHFNSDKPMYDDEEMLKQDYGV